MGTISGVRTLPAILAVGFLLAGCASSPPHFSSDHRGKFRIGQPNYTVAPYQIKGVWYYPKVDYSYDQTGTASWYGEQFNHRPTSDGEIFDMNQLSAAHKTLPLPSVVEVTNLQNGRELRLRVNDRGPFVGDRLIDLSRRAAQLLGFERSGTAQVRVQVLKDDSIQVAEAAMHGGFGPVGIAETGQARQTMVAAAAPPPAPLPRRAPPPAMQMAAAGPASLRASEVIGAPPPARLAPPAPPPRREPPPAMRMAAAAPASLHAPEVIGAPPPARLAPPPEPVQLRPEPVQARPQPAPPPRPVIAASARGYLPSLIGRAHAETFHLLRVPPRAEALYASRAPVLRPVRAEPQVRGRIFVQAGAFAVPGNAQRVRARIAALGRVEIVRAEGRGAALYRVRLGPVASAAEARRLLGRVVDRGYPGARVVSE